MPRSVRFVYAATVILFLGYALHAATNVGGDGLGPLFQKWVNDAVPAGCALICLARAWRVRAERGAWALLGFGIVLWLAGNVYYSLYVIDRVPLPIPSVADGLWLGQYPVSVVAVLLLMRSRHTTEGARVWLDGSIAGLAVSAVCAAIVLPSVLSASGHASTAEYLTNLAYPIGDMVLLGSVGAALGVRHWRLDRTWGSLALGFVAFTVADSLFLVKTAEGTYVVGTIIDAGWLLGGICIATAAWQPAKRQAMAGWRGRPALLLPSAFGSMALVLLIWDHFERLTTAALVLSSASVVAVLARMTLALGENLRMVSRLHQKAEALSMKNEELLEVDRLKEDLRLAQKMDALGRLAGGVAHDFNNLLTVVAGYATLLRSDVAGDPAACRKIGAITTATERAADLTRQLLTFSRRQVVQAAHLDLNESVLETEALMTSALGDDIRLVLNLADDLPAIRADAGQISQVMVNLILNARDAMPQGGTVEIASARGRSEAREDPADGDPDAVLLTITDTGSGIDPETQTRIFEPFFTTKGKGGTGLGLATVYGIVESSGGTITVDSTPEGGSTFSIVFPAAPAAPPALFDDAADAGVGTPQSQRILLVEDERAVRELLVEQLEALGHDVVAAPTPARACEIYEHQPDNFDVVVTDIVMPGIDGWQLVKRLRERRPDLPVVLMSGYTDGAVDALDVVGLTAFLQKPFSIDALAEKMQAVVEQQLTQAAVA